MFLLLAGPVESSYGPLSLLVICSSNRPRRPTLKRAQAQRTALARATSAAPPSQCTGSRPVHAETAACCRLNAARRGPSGLPPAHLLFHCLLCCATPGFLDESSGVASPPGRRCSRGGCHLPPTPRPPPACGANGETWLPSPLPDGRRPHSLPLLHRRIGGCRRHGRRAQRPAGGAGAFLGAAKSLRPTLPRRSRGDPLPPPPPPPPPRSAAAAAAATAAATVVAPVAKWPRGGGGGRAPRATVLIIPPTATAGGCHPTVSTSCWGTWSAGGLRRRHSVLSCRVLRNSMNKACPMEPARSPQQSSLRHQTRPENRPTERDHIEADSCNRAALAPAASIPTGGGGWN